MAGYDRGLDPIRTQFNHEVSHTNYGFTPEVQNQHHEDQTYSSNATGDYQNKTIYNESRSFPLVNVNSAITSNSATGQQYSGNSERENEGIRGEGNTSEERHDRRREVAEIGALRAYHRALKEDKMKSMKTANEAPLEDMSGMEPIAVTFLDKKRGIEYDAFGQIIPPMADDIQPQATEPQRSDDAILPCPEQPSSYGYHYPPGYNPHHPTQSTVQHNGQQPYLAQPDYGYDQPTSNAFQYDPQVPPPQYPGQPYPEWQGGTFYPSDPNQATQPYIYNQPSAVVPKVPDYMGCSIMVFLCCCWPFGLAAIRQASAAKEAARQGNYVQAMEHARSSKTWNFWGVIWGIVCYVIVGVSIYFRMQAYKAK